MAWSLSMGVSRSYDTSMTIRARFVSLGGIVLIGIWLSVFALMTLAWSHGFWTRHPFVTTTLFFSLSFYLGRSSTERLMLDEFGLTFSVWPQRDRHLPIGAIHQVRWTHEGLNQEIGIETLTLVDHHGEYVRWSLGPLWRKRDLTKLLDEVRVRLGKGSVVEEG